MRSKKSAKEAHDQWCVILNPISSELSKTETVEKIVETFPLSIEEASQLVERTPIILLDELNYDTAKKIKGLFGAVNADLLLTDDTYLKRKCYRTVWSQDPLHKINLMNVESAAMPLREVRAEPRTLQKEKLSKESAIQDVRRASVGGVSTIAETTQAMQQTNSKYVEGLNKEKVAAEQEVAELKKEIFELRRQANLNTQTNNEFEYLSMEIEKAKETLLEKDLTVEKLTKALQQERKTSAQLQAKVEEVGSVQPVETSDNSEALDKAKLDNERLKGLLQDLQSDNEELRKVQKSYSELQNKYEYLETEIRDFAAKRSTVEDIEDHNARLEQKLEEKDLEIEGKRERIAHLQKELQQKLTVKDSEHGQLQFELRSSQDEERRKDELVKRLQSEKKQMKILVDDLQRDNEELRQSTANYEGLEQKYSYLEGELKEFARVKELLEEAEEKCETLSATVTTSQETISEKLNVIEEKDVRIESLGETVGSLEDRVADMGEQLKTATQLLNTAKDDIQEKQKEKESLQSSLAELENENNELKQVKTNYEKLEEQYKYLENELQEFANTKEELKELHEKYSTVIDDSQQKETKVVELQSELSATTKAYNTAREEASVVQSGLEEKQREVKAEFEQYRKDADQVIQEKSKLIEEAEAKLTTLGKVNETLEASMSERVSQLAVTSGNLSDVQEKYTILQAEFAAYKNKTQQAVSVNMRTAEEQALRIAELENNCNKLIEQNERQQKAIQEFTVRKQEQEDMQKRIQLQHKIAELELQLRTLVKSEDQFKNQILENEHQIKELLSQQDGIEKNLVRLKQEQKHIAERAKVKGKQRLRSTGSRVNIVSPGNGVPQEK